MDTPIVVEESINTGVAEGGAPSLGLFTPTHRGQLFLSAGNGPVRAPAEVINAAGQRMMAPQLDGTPVDVSRLQPGVYVLRVLDDQGVMQARFVKVTSLFLPGGSRTGRYAGRSGDSTNDPHVQEHQHAQWQEGQGSTTPLWNMLRGSRCEERRKPHD